MGSSYLTTRSCGIARRQFAGIENHTSPNRTAFRGVTVEGFNDENSAGLQSALEDRSHFTPADVAEDDHVPTAIAKVKVFHPHNLRLEVHAELPGSFLSEGNGFFGWVEASDVPTLLGEPYRVAPLPHADIQSSPGLAAFCHLHQEFVWFDVEARILPGQDAVPAFDLGTGALCPNEFDLGIGISIRKAAGFQMLPVARQ